MRVEGSGWNVRIRVGAGCQPGCHAMGDDATSDRPLAECHNPLARHTLGIESSRASVHDRVQYKIGSQTTPLTLLLPCLVPALHPGVTGERGGGDEPVERRRSPLPHLPRARPGKHLQGGAGWGVGLGRCTTKYKARGWGVGLGKCTTGYKAWGWGVGSGRCTTGEGTRSDDAGW